MKTEQKTMKATVYEGLLYALKKKTSIFLPIYMVGRSIKHIMHATASLLACDIEEKLSCKQHMI